jgi:VWFA-related protein
MTLYLAAVDRRRSPTRAARSLSSSWHLSPLLLALIFLLAAFPVSTLAQADEDSGDVLRVRTDLVTVPAFVTEASGRRVAGLTRSDFTVRDNGQPVQISYFAAGTEHVALAFALDVSGSTREIIRQQRAAALDLFSRFGRGSRVAVIHFGERAELAVPFTTDSGRALSAFELAVRPGQRTAIFDAAASALGAFGREGSSASERRILVLISDGLDTVSRLRAPAVIRQARTLGVSIYVVHLPLYAPRDGRLAARPAAKGFRDLAEKTGGRYFMAGDVKSALDPHAVPDLMPVFKSIEEDLAGQYVLGYYPDEAGREAAVHRIEIGLASRGRLRVQALRDEYTLKGLEPETPN